MNQILMPVIRKKSSWGPNDPHIPKLHFLAKEITEHLDLDDNAKDEVDFLADRLMDKLESALMYYQLIMADDFETRNISQKRTIYEGLYANLWSLYKGRVQNYIRGMGWNTAFIFCNVKNFEKESRKFVEENPELERAVKFAANYRKSWQNDFGRSRDVAEHHGDYRDGTSSFETQDDAKRSFTQVCWSAESWIAFFGSYKMLPDWNVVELDSKITIFDRNPRYVIEHSVMTAQRERSSKK